MRQWYRSCTVLVALVVILLCSLSLPTWAEDGVTDKEVTVGAGLDLTGAVANWGVNIKAGMEAVFNRVNEAGGVHGRKIKLIAYDHVYQPPKAVANAKRLVERDKVFIMMGHLGTPTTKAIKDYLRVHHDLDYTVSSTNGGTAHVTLPRYYTPYYRGLRFDKLDRGRVCGSGADV